MKRILLVLCFLCLVVPVWAEEQIELNSLVEIGDISISSVPQYTSITFGVDFDPDEVLVISWDNGIVDVKYSNATEAAETFFEFLKVYIQETYDIIPKTKEVK